MKSIAFLALALALGISAGAASAQGNPPQPMAPPNAGPMGMRMKQQMGIHPMAGMHEHERMASRMMHEAGAPGGTPTEPGQAAFGAIQEIVRTLLTDPMTNWSKVNIDALRQHLVDMDEVTMHADAKKEPIAKGLRISVTGSGRTLAAIQRMVPAHAQDINGLYGWSVQAKAVPSGEEMTVTGNNTSDEQKIRALGFMGIMVLGTHQMHHLAIAKGEMTSIQ
jgi:hypothetical protein